jgi:hypothetical protein
MRSFSTSGGSSPGGPLSPNRPQLRRESAQDLGDGEEGGGRMRLPSQQPSLHNPPDLKIDLLSDTSSPVDSHSLQSPMSRSSDNSKCGPGLILLGKTKDNQHYWCQFINNFNVKYFYLHRKMQVIELL